jgi:hypothetical protein
MPCESALAPAPDLLRHHNKPHWCDPFLIGSGSLGGLYEGLETLQGGCRHLPGGLIISSNDYGGAAGASPHAGHARASVFTTECRRGFCEASLIALQRSFQTPDGRGVYAVGPRHIRLRFASREACNRFLSLMGRQLAGYASMCAHTTLTTLRTRRRS